MPKRVGVIYRNEKKVAPYLRALENVDVEPVRIRASDPEPAEPLDGLLLIGGGDLNPRLYHQEPHPESEKPDDERDALEQQMLKTALERDLPVLAICRGMQLFNVAHGGTLEQHIDGHVQRGVADAHRIDVDAGTKLAQMIGAGTHVVNSRHHQVVDQVGSGLKVTARSEDGYPEALERADKKFAVAVQWHPEDLIDNDDTRRLFQQFADSL